MRLLSAVALKVASGFTRNSPDPHAGTVIGGLQRGMSTLAIESWSLPGERLGGGRVKGAEIRAHLDWVRDHRSREETIELFETLPDDVRRQVSTVLSSSWYDLAMLIAVDRVILSLFGQGDLTLLEQVGAYSARMTLPAISRFLPSDGLHDFFRRLARLRSQPEDSGRVEYRKAAPTAGIMEHFDDATISPLRCATAIGYYRECIHLHDRHHVAVTEIACRCSGATSCAYRIQWR